MRKIAILGLFPALALALVGCADSGDSAGGTTSPGARVVEIEGQKVTIEGDPGAAPILRFDKPLNITKQAIYPVSKGSGGAAIEEGQLLGINYTVTSAEDGSDLKSTWATDSPEGLIFSSNEQAGLPAELYDALKGGATFSQIIQVSPGSDQSPAPMILFMEVDSAQTIPPRAEGSAQPAPADMPQVTLDENGKPSVTMPAGDPPTELQRAVTIQGNGDYVDASDAVAVNYTGWLWDGKQFDSSWDRGVPMAFSLGQQQVIPGWENGLATMQVGSQVLLVIPPDQAYGDKANGSIPANSTLVFVIDILGKVGA